MPFSSLLHPALERSPSSEPLRCNKDFKIILVFISFNGVHNKFNILLPTIKDVPARPHRYISFYARQVLDRFHRGFLDIICCCKWVHILHIGSEPHLQFSKTYLEFPGSLFWIWNNILKGDKRKHCIKKKTILSIFTGRCHRCSFWWP